MIETLRHFTDTRQIHEIERDDAQVLYDDAMARASEPDDPMLTEAGQRAGAEYRQDLAFAAEEFAYAFFNQNGSPLDGAADPDGFDYDMVGPFAARPVLTGLELRKELLKHLQMNYPDTLPFEMR